MSTPSSNCCAGRDGYGSAQNLRHGGFETLTQVEAKMMGDAGLFIAIVGLVKSHCNSTWNRGGSGGKRVLLEDTSCELLVFWGVFIRVREDGWMVLWEGRKEGRREGRDMKP